MAPLKRYSRNDIEKIWTTQGGSFGSWPKAPDVLALKDLAGNVRWFKWSASDRVYYETPKAPKRGLTMD